MHVCGGLRVCVCVWGGGACEGGVCLCVCLCVSVCVCCNVLSNVPRLINFSHLLSDSVTVSTSSEDHSM